MFTILVVAFALYGLWILFLAVMSIKRARLDKELTTIARILSYPIIYLTLVVDILVNVFVFTFVFMELPREVLVSQRLRKHIIRDDGWRTVYAKWLCANLLDIFDPTGCHCKEHNESSIF